MILNCTKTSFTQAYNICTYIDNQAYSYITPFPYSKIRPYFNNSLIFRLCMLNSIYNITEHYYQTQWRWLIL